MSAYVYPNFKTKKKLREALAAGEHVTACEQTPFGENPVEQGTATIEGPHYPQPHTWYARVEVVNGRVIKVTS